MFHNVKKEIWNEWAKAAYSLMCKNGDDISIFKYFLKTNPVKISRATKNGSPNEYSVYPKSDTPFKAFKVVQKPPEPRGNRSGVCRDTVESRPCYLRAGGLAPLRGCGCYYLCHLTQETQPPYITLLLLLLLLGLLVSTHIWPSSFVNVLLQSLEETTAESGDATKSLITNSKRRRKERKYTLHVWCVYLCVHHTYIPWYGCDHVHSLSLCRCVSEAAIASIAALEVTACPWDDGSLSSGTSTWLQPLPSSSRRRAGHRPATVKPSSDRR